MKKMLITGGAGFIGSNFIHYILSNYNDYQVINLDKLTYAANLENLKDIEDNKNYKFIHGDIADQEFIFKLFEDKKLVAGAIIVLFGMMCILSVVALIGYVMTDLEYKKEYEKRKSELEKWGV